MMGHKVTCSTHI